MLCFGADNVLFAYRPNGIVPAEAAGPSVDAPATSDEVRTETRLPTAGMLDHGLKVRPMVLPDRFIDHAAPQRQYAEAGLDAPHIVTTALAALGRQAERARG